MVVNLVDIAREVGLDVSVVSRALNPGRVPHPVKKETRELIIATAKRLGYRPNRQAAFLKKGSAATLMCYVPDIGHRLVADLVYGISEEAADADYPVNFFFGRTSDDFCRFYQTLRKVPHAAAICYSPPPAKTAAWRRGGVRFTLPTMKADSRKEILGYHYRRKTLLLLNLESNLDLGEEHEIGVIPRIEIDEECGGRKVAEHFLESGCTRFFYGTGKQTYPLRLEGYFAALRERGIEAQPLTRTIIRKMAKSDERCGIFVTTDFLAIDLIGILREEHIPIGKKVLISGYDDISTSAEIRPSLTTAHPPTRQEGRLAVQLVQKCIAGEEIGIQRLEPLLMIRETSGVITNKRENLQGMEE